MKRLKLLSVASIILYSVVAVLSVVVMVLLLAIDVMNDSPIEEVEAL